MDIYGHRGEDDASQDDLEGLLLPEPNTHTIKAASQYGCPNIACKEYDGMWMQDGAVRKHHCQNDLTPHEEVPSGHVAIFAFPATSE